MRRLWSPSKKRRILLGRTCPRLWLTARRRRLREQRRRIALLLQKQWQWALLVRAADEQPLPLLKGRRQQLASRLHDARTGLSLRTWRL